MGHLPYLFTLANKTVALVAQILTLLLLLRCLRLRRWRLRVHPLASLAGRSRRLAVLVGALARSSVERLLPPLVAQRNQLLRRRLDVVVRVGQHVQNQRFFGFGEEALQVSVGGLECGFSDCWVVFAGV